MAQVIKKFPIALTLAELASYGASLKVMFHRFNAKGLDFSNGSLTLSIGPDEVGAFDESTLTVNFGTTPTLPVTVGKLSELLQAPQAAVRLTDPALAIWGLSAVGPNLIVLCAAQLDDKTNLIRN